MKQRLAIRIDVDTIQGLHHGLPVLLGILEDTGVRATIFLPTGPDVPSLTLARIAFSPERIQQMLRLRPAGRRCFDLAIAGLLTQPLFFYQTLPGIRNKLLDHELALHGYDHWRWIFNIHRWSTQRVKTEIRRGLERFKSVFGHDPIGFGAPGWQTTPASISAVDAFTFSYASDCRGSAPFRPLGYRTPQIPTTLPTLEDAVRISDRNEEMFLNGVLQRLENSLNNCYCAHCETEGIRFPSFFHDLISQAKERNITVCPLSELIRDDTLPEDVIEYRRIPGRFDSVSWQTTTPLV